MFCLVPFFCRSPHADIYNASDGLRQFGEYILYLRMTYSILDEMMSVSSIGF